MPALPDIAAQYLQGVHIGAAIAQERQRIKAENTRTAMEAQARAETNNRMYLEEQARNETEKAYRTAVLGLQQQKLAAAQQVNQQRTQHAATVMAHQHGFDIGVAAGKPIPELMAQFPLANASTAMQLQKDTELQKERESSQDFRNRSISVQEAREKRESQPKPEKPVRTGETVVTDPETGDKTTAYTFGTPGATPIPPSTAKAAPEVKALPQRKEDLEKGGVYQTHSGPRVWDGDHFVIQTAQP
jgi:hypothetical protein